MTDLELAELAAKMGVSVELKSEDVAAWTVPVALGTLKRLIDRARRANALESYAELRANNKPPVERALKLIDEIPKLAGSDLEKDADELCKVTIDLMMRPPMACYACERHNEDLADIVAALVHKNVSMLQPDALAMLERITAGTDFLATAVKAEPETEEGFNKLLASMKPTGVDPAAPGQDRSAEIVYQNIDGEKRIVQRGVDFACESCGKLEGSTLDNGWYRCNACGYPGK